MGNRFFLVYWTLQGEFAVVGDKKVTLCHEFSGTIVELGTEAAKKFKVGDMVGVDPNRPCHTCQFCVRGQVHFCQDGGCRDATGIFRDGGLAEFCQVPAEQVDEKMTYANLYES